LGKRNYQCKVADYYYQEPKIDWITEDFPGIANLNYMYISITETTYVKFL